MKGIVLGEPLWDMTRIRNALASGSVNLEAAACAYLYLHAALINLPSRGLVMEELVASATRAGIMPLLVACLSRGGFCTIMADHVISPFGVVPGVLESLAAAGAIPALAKSLTLPDGLHAADLTPCIVGASESALFVLIDFLYRCPRFKAGVLARFKADVLACGVVPAVVKRMATFGVHKSIPPPLSLGAGGTLDSGQILKNMKDEITFESVIGAVGRFCWSSARPAPGTPPIDPLAAAAFIDAGVLSVLVSQLAAFQLHASQGLACCGGRLNIVVASGLTTLLAQLSSPVSRGESGPSCDSQVLHGRRGIHHRM